MEAGLTMGFLFSVGFPLVVFLVGETERGGGGKTAMDWNVITNSVHHIATHLLQATLKIKSTHERYPSLRVAYIDEVEEPSKDASKKINQKVYYSVLVKAALPKSANSLEAI
ncbi:Callose synthase 3 [Camellia lanceoleosa]|uniref:Callose synthase 3 n=1 Tax=Camellia lanceoleosa TaxID=1840588 RepID=A0ACC0F8Q7_9ERIC|nr:Callose synthase 3 [Camellia lanceoleosa]